MMFLVLLLELFACFEYFLDSRSHGFECTRAGSAVRKVAEEGKVARNRASLKCRCDFMVRAILTNAHDPENPTSEIWKISKSNLTHTNGCNPGAAQLLLASQAAGLATRYASFVSNSFVRRKALSVGVIERCSVGGSVCLYSSTRTLFYSSIARALQRSLLLQMQLTPEYGALRNLLRIKYNISHQPASVLRNLVLRARYAEVTSFVKTLFNINKFVICLFL
jgi:hypothetical protein